MTEEALFDLVLMTPEAERAALLDRECAGNAVLRARLDALLSAHADASMTVDSTQLDRRARPLGALERKEMSDHIAKNEAAGVVIAGRYALVEPIGEGGMGSVWRAKQTEPVKRFVAVKLIKAGMDSKMVLARFEAERQALALMDHPNIAKVLDGGLHEHRPYFVMELVKGTPITEYCDHCKLTPQQRLELFVQVCNAIQHAHQKGIIHRDIKPSNVMIALYDDKPVVKVIDFGVAKATGGTLTEQTIDTGFGGVVGTPQYMSPEQATFNNVDIDTRSDVYALGVLLYELLTGSTPFSNAELKKKGLLEILRVVREEEPPRPSTKLSTADALPSLSANRGTEPKKLTGLLRNELDWIVMKSLEKDRARRYDTANGFAADVLRYLGGEAVLAHPPSRGYRIQKFVRRNKGQVLAASVIAVALVAGIVGTTFGFIRAKLAKEEETLQRIRAGEEEGKAQAALTKSLKSEESAITARKSALRTAANSGCDVAQQLCEKNSVAQGLIEYGQALRFANEAQDADLEDAIRWNIGTWASELHPLAYTIDSRLITNPMGAFHPAGKILAVGGQTPKYDAIVIQLHHADDGTPLPETLRIEGRMRVQRLAWQPAGGHLGIYAGDGKVYLWKPGENTPTISFTVDPINKFPENSQRPHFAFSPDGRQLIAGTSQAVARVFDVSSGKPTGLEMEHTNLHPESSATASVDWSRDGTRLITGNHNGHVKIWEAKTGKLIREIVVGLHGLQSVRFSADGKYFVSASGWGHPKVQVWNVATGEPVGPPMPHRENVYDANFSPDGKLILSADAGNEAFIWEIGSSRVIGAPIWTGGHMVHAEFSPDGLSMLINRIALIQVNRLGAPAINPLSISRIDPQDARVAPFVEKYKDVVPGVGENGEPHNYTQLTLSPDGKILIKYAFVVQALIEMIDAKTLKSIRELPGTPSTAAVYWKPDSKEFVGASHGLTKIRNATTGEAKANLGRCEPWTGSFNPDGSRFAIASKDYQLRLYDTNTWKQAGPSLPHTCRVAISAFSRDGKLAFSSDTDWHTRAWHPTTGKRIGPVFQGAYPYFSHDNRTFSTWDPNTKLIMGYRVPLPNSETVVEIVRQIENLTNLHLSTESLDEPMPVPSKTIGPDQAAASVGQFVNLEMTVASVRVNTSGEWMYLNSETNYKNPKNATFAIKFPTLERRKAMGLDREDNQIVGRRARVTGKVSLYLANPQIIVEDTDQFQLLPPTDK